MPRGVEPNDSVGDGRLEGGVMVNRVGTGGGGGCWVVDEVGGGY